MLKVLGNYLVVQHTNFLVDFIEHTLYNELLRIARNLLEIRENIKIESRSFYVSHNLWLIFMGIKQKNWPILKMAVSPILKKFL